MRFVKDMDFSRKLAIIGLIFCGAICQVALFLPFYGVAYNGVYVDYHVSGWDIVISNAMQWYGSPIIFICSIVLIISPSLVFAATLKRDFRIAPYVYISMLVLSIVASSFILVWSFRFSIWFDHYWLWAIPENIPFLGIGYYLSVIFSSIAIVLGITALVLRWRVSRVRHGQ